MPAPEPNPTAEMVALVDQLGREIGQAPRTRVRAENLRHAATAVLVRNSRGEIFVHRRSAEKDWAPSHHDAAVGGVLRAGEDVGAAAARELAEELGVVGAELAPLGLASFADATNQVVEHIFATVWDGPITFADGEIVWGVWMSLPELALRLRDPGWLFVPDTRALLDRLARDGVADYSALLGGKYRAG